MVNASPGLPSEAVHAMARKQPNRAGPGSGDARQVAFRAPTDLYRQLEFVSEGLGLDISNLVRMILRKHIIQYVREVEELKRDPESA